MCLVSLSLDFLSFEGDAFDEEEDFDEEDAFDEEEASFLLVSLSLPLVFDPPPLSSLGLQICLGHLSLPFALFFLIFSMPHSLSC